MRFIKRAVLLLLSFIGAAGAQTAAITSPAASAVVNGDGITYQYTLTSTCAACGAIYSAEYDLDGAELLGISRTRPYSYVWNPYNAGNGVHTVTVTYRDVLNNLIATSPAVSFFIENNLPQNTCATTCTDIAVTPQILALINLSTGSSTLGSAISFYGASAPSVRGNAKCGSSNTGSVTCTGTSAGDMVAVWFEWNAGVSDTLTCANSTGGTAGYNTQGALGTSFSGQWCYFIGTSGGSATVTAAVVGAPTMSGAIAFDISGVTALDVNATPYTAGAAPIQSSGFVLGYPASQELILFGGATNTVTTASAENGWPTAQIAQNPSKVLSASWVNPPSGWFGTENIATTVNGPNSGISKKFTIFVDGASYSPGSATTTSATYSMIYDTTQNLNLSHTVVMSVSGGNCPGCINGVWSSMGIWEQKVAFNNLAAPSYLTSSARELTLCTTSQTNCPTSTALTGTIVNADGTTSAATITCSSSNTAVVTIAGTCTPTVAGPTGSALVTMTSGSLTRTAWVNVLPANTLPHFLNNGTISTTYVPCSSSPSACSIWMASSFFSSSGINPIPQGQTSLINYPAIFAPQYRAGFNTIESGATYPGSYGSAGAFQAGVASDATLFSGYYSNYGLYTHLIADSEFRNTPDLYKTMYGAWSAWGAGGIGAWQHILAQYVASGVRIIGVSMVDEVTGSWALRPLAGLDTGGILLGTSYFTSPMNCVAGGNCSMTLSNMTFNTGNRFVITGSGDPNLDYNTTSGAPANYGLNGSNTFLTPAGVGTKSYTSASYPGLMVEPYAYETFDSSSTACPPAGSSAGPCPGYVHYDVFKNVRLQTLAVSNHPAITWPSVSGSSGTTIAQWCGGVSNAGITLADYCEAYWSDGTTYLPTKKPLLGVLNSIGYSGTGVKAAVYPNMNTQTPLVYETQGVMNDYLYHGYPVTLASCSGYTCTTTTPHHVYNILPDETRVQISGSSAADGNYYIIAAPTAYTFQIADANSTVSGSGTGAALTFQDGTQYTGITISPSTGGNTPGNMSSIPCPGVKVRRGQTFTIAGSSNAGLNSSAGGWFDAAGTNASCQGGSNPWRLLPSLASTGGTANIILDNYGRRGVNWQTDSDSGPADIFTTVTSAFLWNGAGSRAYGFQPDPGLCDYSQVSAYTCFVSGVSYGFSLMFGGTAFDGTQGPQAGLNPSVNAYRSIESFQAQTTANQLAERLVPYAFQQRLAAPDYGPFYEASARTGAKGNLLMIQSYHDNVESCTANLTPYLVSGQPIIRISATWAGIEPIVILPPGTGADSMTCAPGEFRAYLFPVNEAAELQQPNISARLNDVAGAAKIVVQFSYSPLAFSKNSVRAQSLFQTFDAGTGTFTLPVDRQIGSVYYRLMYLDTNSQVIATSDIQTF